MSGGGQLGATFGSISLTSRQWRYLGYGGIGLSALIPGVGAYRLYKGGRYALAAIAAGADIIGTYQTVKYFHKITGGPGQTVASAGGRGLPGSSGGIAGGGSAGYARGLSQRRRLYEYLS